MSENFENIESAVETKKAKEESYQKNVEKQVETTGMRNGKFERRRYTRKAELAQLVATWREELKTDAEVLKDKELEKIFREVEAYVKLDVTATHYKNMNEKKRFETAILTAKAGVRKESNQVMDLFQDVKNYIKKYEELDNNTDKVSTLEEQEVRAKRQIMAYNLEVFLEDQIAGYLPEVPKGAYHIKSSDNIKTTRIVDRLWDYRDRPLFPHDPSPSDVRQGALGDCYMVSLLANAARKNPDIIKETIRDNGNGTVTVRLFKRIPPTTFPPVDTLNDEFEPFYVTVDKTAPLGSGSLNSLWVAMIEKAVVASGLSVDRNTSGMYARPVPANIDEIYEKYKDMPEYLRPSKADYPWLYDEKNNFVKWQPKYEHIIGGFSEEFGETLLGPEYEGYRENLSNFRDGVANETAYNYMLTLLGRASSQDFVQKIKAVLDPLENSKDKLMNAAKVLKAVKNKEIDVQTYQPKFKEMMNSQQSKKELEGLDEGLYDNAYRGFAEILGKELSNMLFEMNLSEKTPEQRLSLLEEQVKDALEKKQFGDKEKEYADSLLKEFAEDKGSVVEGIDGREYPAAYLEKFEEIRQELEKGTIVGASTPDSAKGDSDSNGGLNYEHAYNVLGVEEEEINGKTYKFFYVRNPHGTSRMPEYDFTTNPPRAMEVHHKKSEGIFKVELSHFLNCIDTIDYNGKVLDEKLSQKVNENRIDAMKKNRDYRYGKLFEVIYKDLTKALEKEDFSDDQKKEELQNDIRTLAGIPKQKSDEEMPAPDFRTIDMILTTLESTLEDENLNPDTTRILKSSMKLLHMYEQDVKDPVASMGEDFAGTAWPTSRSLYDFIEMKDQNEFLAGIKMAEGEGVQLLKIVRTVNPKRITSSQQYKDMLSKVEKFGDTFISLKKEPSGKKMEAYIQSLKDLGEASKTYLEFKTAQRTKNGKIVYKSNLERERVNAARKILEYSVEKSEKLEKSYVKMSLAFKMYKTMFPEHEVQLQDYPISDLRKSKEFKDVIAGKNIEELKAILKNEDKVKDMTTQLETKRKEMPENYVEEVKRELEQVFNSSLSTKEEKINAAAKMVYGLMVYSDQNVYERTTERLVRAKEKDLVDFIKKDEKFTKLVEGIGTEYVSFLGKMHEIRPVQVELQTKLEKEHNMSIFEWFKKQDKEIDYGMDLDVLEEEVDNVLGR